jgi:hypothetical protein
MSATLRLTRGVFGIELRRGPFEFSIDGEPVGSIKMNETVETPIGPGHHTLQVRAGRYSSPQRSFEAADEEVVNFRCRGPAIWPVWVASLVVPAIGIALMRE